MENFGHRKPVLILLNGLSKPESERMTESLISADGGIRITTSWSTVQRIVTELSPLRSYNNWNL